MIDSTFLCEVHAVSGQEKSKLGLFVKLIAVTLSKPLLLFWVLTVQWAFQVGPFELEYLLPAVEWEMFAGIIHSCLHIQSPPLPTMYVLYSFTSQLPGQPSILTIIYHPGTFCNKLAPSNPRQNWNSRSNMKSRNTRLLPDETAYQKASYALMKLVSSWIPWCEPENKLTLRWCTTQTFPTNPRHRHNIYMQLVIQIHSNIDQKILFCSSLFRFGRPLWRTNINRDRTQMTTWN